jgi:hypothetical protein
MVEPHNGELDVCTHWELEEQVTNPFRRTCMLGTTKFRTWCEHIDNLMGTWWGTHIENLRNRLQSHSEEHAGNHKIQNLMWTHWQPDGNRTRSRHWELEEQVTNPLRRTWWNHIKFESLMWAHWGLDHRNLVTTIYSKLGMSSKSKNIQN